MRTIKILDRIKNALAVISLLVIIAPSVHAATITAIANGGWADVSVWDCNCLPDSTDDIIIGDALTINTAAAVTINSITVNANAVFTVNGGTLTVTSSVTILSLGAFNNSYIVQIGGDITNTGALSGPGSYCVAGVSTNNLTGIMLGPMDFCDLTPPSSAPFVDVNNGFIESGVLYCQNGICIPTGVAEEEDLNSSKISVAYGDGFLWVSYQEPIDNDVFIELIDLQGRVVWKNGLTESNRSFPVAEDLNGIYLYRLSSPERIIDQGKILIK